MMLKLRKPVKWLLILVIFVSTVLGVNGSVSVQNAQASPKPGMSFFGMNMYVTGSERPKAEKYAMLSAGADLGVQWTREEMSWANIEVRQGVFDWTAYDFWINALVKQNIQIVGVLETTPSWASGVRDSVEGGTGTRQRTPSSMATTHTRWRCAIRARSTCGSFGTSLTWR